MRRYFTSKLVCSIRVEVSYQETRLWYPRRWSLGKGFHPYGGPFPVALGADFVRRHRSWDLRCGIRAVASFAACRRTKQTPKGARGKGLQRRGRRQSMTQRKTSGLFRGLAPKVDRSGVRSDSRSVGQQKKANANRTEANPCNVFPRGSNQTGEVWTATRTLVKGSKRSSTAAGKIPRGELQTSTWLSSNRR